VHSKISHPLTPSPPPPPEDNIKYSLAGVGEKVGKVLGGSFGHRRPDLGLDKNIALYNISEKKFRSELIKSCHNVILKACENGCAAGRMLLTHARLNTCFVLDFDNLLICCATNDFYFEDFFYATGLPENREKLSKIDFEN